MPLSRPPLGGATCISRSTPDGGQMTPFDCASLSLNGAEPPPPTVGGSPLTSGGQAASCAGASGGALPAACADAAPTPARLADISPIKGVRRKTKASAIAILIEKPRAERHLRAVQSDPRRHARCCRGQVGAVASDELAPARGALLLIAGSAHRELGQRGVEGGSLLARGDAELVKRLHVLAVERTATRIVEPFIDAGDAHPDALP